MSVGAFCVAELINLSYSKEFGFGNLVPLRYISRVFAFAAVILGGVFSIFHLKNWAHAYHALNNLKTSWVSKEIALFFLFVSCVAFLALLSWRKIKSNLLQHVIGIAGALSGLALIYSMAKIYMLPAIPSWSAWTTPGLFFTAALLLGTLAIVVLYSTNFIPSKSGSLAGDIRERWRKRTFPNLIKLLLFFIVARMLITGFFAHRLLELTEEFGTEMTILNPDRRILFFFSIALYVFGWTLLFYGLKKTRQSNGIQEKLHGLVLGAATLIALAEILGRYLFYVSFFKIGV
jgi:anaerobic dimethyl sulfoxide reductase subunit C (anchor subunit)